MTEQKKSKKHRFFTYFFRGLLLLLGLLVLTVIFIGLTEKGPAAEQVPAEGQPVITVQRNPEFASFIELPVMERGSQRAWASDDLPVLSLEF